MNHNIENLLNILLQQNDYLTSSQLSMMLGVTERSVRNYVSTLNRNGKNDALILSSNKGYKIQRDVYNDSIKNRLFDIDESKLLFRIALILINHKRYMSYDELAQELNYSMENIRIKVQLLFSKIDEMNIKLRLDSKIFTGIRIIGSEIQKRLLLEQLVQIERITRDNPERTASKVLNQLLSQTELKIIYGALDALLSKEHVTMDFIVHSKIICHMAILQYRLKNRFEIVGSKKNEQKDDSPEYKLALKILTSTPWNNTSVSEVSALKDYFISLPISIPGIFIPVMDTEQKKMIEHSLKNAEKYYSIPIFSNLQYRTQIINHIMRLFNPLEESIPIFNPYSRETKREYLFAYSIACFLYDDLQSTIQLKIPESEIAYLAIHIQLILNEKTKNTIDTVLMFQGKLSEGELLRYKLQTFFPKIKVSFIVADVSLIELSRYQLVILCETNFTDISGPNVIKVTRQLNATDISQLQLFVDSFGTHSLINNLDYYHLNATNNIQAIQYLVSKSGYSSLIPYFIKRESMSPTDIGNMVALPHPFLKGSETTAKIIVGINDVEIPWGHQSVRLIIIYIPAADLKTNRNFFNDVYQRTSDIATIQRLLKSENKQEFIDIWNKKGRF